MINKIIYFILLNCIFSAEPIHHTSNSDTRSDFLEDRAKGYLLKGKAKTAITNYGNFITWDHQPAGLWNNFTYLPNLGFITGIPGHEYSSKWSTPGYNSWSQEEILIGQNSITIWGSSDAYSEWVGDNTSPEERNFATIVYNTIDDRGDIAAERNTVDDIAPDGDPQWVLDSDSEKIYLYLDDLSLDPNYASSLIGLAYPWAIRPQFVERTDEYDIYEYGNDEEAWTDDDDYVYYGANTAESWFSRDGTPQVNTDWQAAKDARLNTHNLDNTVGEIFGDTPWADPYDPEHLLAHSEYPSTWPEKYNFDSGSYEPSWPGWWADEYYGDSPDLWSSLGIYDCNGTYNDDGCWKPLQGKHISDMDVYMEFDDRWASLGNQIVDNQYEATGYPLGLKVMSMSHSYGNAQIEDILFFTVKIRNESGDYCAFEKNKNGFAIQVLDENGAVICGEGMIMPDGTKLNRGAGFDYQKVSMGFYMDADVLSTDATGGFSVHTNEDDFMQYIDCKISSEEYPDGCPVVNDDTLRISMAVVGDWDGHSNSATGYGMGTGQTLGPDFGVVAVQLLDSPYSTGYVDLDQDGYFDIFPGEKLKMTDWHWFDWYSRPGVVSTESNSNCCAGTPGRPQALNKEEIQYKVMAGDNTNLTAGEKERYFHTANPNADLDSELNPHFDSLDGLEETSYFQESPEGLDCVLEMTTGPFDLEVGEQINLSFVLLFGQNIEDLKENAYTAQIVYNYHYYIQPYPTEPSAPELTATPDTYSITLDWDNSAESSIDYLTETTDFQGYRIYRSLDHGNTWGDTLFNAYGEEVGWQPIIQFDLDDDISGADPLAPWVSLGDNTGLQYTYTDTNLFAYNEYCYAVTAYDSGLEPGNYEEGWFDFSDGFPSQESSINANKICLNLDVPPDPLPAEALFEASETNIGWGQITYLPHNVDVENDGLFKFEIKAEIDTNTFLNSATLNPKLFVYEVDENGYQISEYLVQDFPIYSLYEESGEYEWLDILGMYIKIENLNSNFINNPLALVELEEVMFSDTLLSDIIDVKMRWKNHNDLPLQPYFDYQIEFNSDFIDYAVQTAPMNSCNDTPEGNTPLPFAITNITTDKQVKVLHSDKGVEDGSINFGEVYSGVCVPVCIPAEICGEEECVPRTGYNNCQWERNEVFTLIDTVSYNNSSYDERIFALKIDFNLEGYYDNVGADLLNTNIWVEGETYLSGEIVYHEGMLYQATEEMSISNAPDEWFDNNGDDINDNPWQILYPWEDGDSATIITRKKLHDGDSWLVDMSKLGDCTADLGNVNDDDYVNILDIVSIVNVIVGNAEFDTNQNCTADFNQDGEVDILDVVELVNMIMGYDDALLSRSNSPKHLSISLSENSIRVPADGAFGGLQISTEGQYSITEMQIPEGLELYKGPTGIVIINLTGRTQKSDIIISYRGELKIIDHLASDLFGQELLTKMVGVPTMYTLNHAYPNPFNPVTTIQYGVPMESQIKLAIYDLLGREVTILYSDIQIAGYHKIIWDASQYASGMYFVQLISEDFVQTQKLMLVK